MPKHGLLGSRALTGARDVIDTTRRRRRLIVEGLVCALVAVFAAQPALAGGPKDNPGNGNGNANANGQANGHGPPAQAAAPAVAAAPAPATAAKADAPGKSENSKGAAATAGTSDKGATSKTGSASPGNSANAPGRTSSAAAKSATGASNTNVAPPAGKSSAQAGKAEATAAAAVAATQSTPTAPTGTAAPATTPKTPTTSPRTGSRTATPSSGTSGSAGGAVGTTGATDPAGPALPVAGPRADLGGSPTRSADRLDSRQLVDANPVEEKRYDGFSKVTHGLASAATIIPGEIWLALLVLGLLVLLLSANTIVAAARTRHLKRQRAKLMEDVGLLQEALLPSVAPLLGGLATTVAYRPAAGLAAGGDFYDAFELPGGRIGLLLGDVSGHGRDALAKTSLVRFTVRAHLEAGMTPREAISIAGRSLDGRLGEDFSTVVAAIHDPAAGTLTYASAGHPPPLVLGPSAHTALTNSSAPPLGVGFPTGQRQTVLPMPEGTTVVLLSDGLLESRIDGEAIGPERLAAWVAEMGQDATAAKLVDLVIARADGVRDDLAAVVLHAAPGATAPDAAIEQLKLDVLDTHGPSLDGFLRAAGVPAARRRATGRRVSEQLAGSGATLVEVTTGDPPQLRVEPLGTNTSDAPRERVRSF